MTNPTQTPPRVTATDEELARDIDHLKARASRIAQSIMETSKMKYALESIPDLIGERQFRDLCIAMGIEIEIQPPSGDEFAQAVSARVVKHHRDHARRQMRSAAEAKERFG